MLDRYDVMWVVGLVMVAAGLYGQFGVWVTLIVLGVAITVVGISGSIAPSKKTGQE